MQGITIVDSSGRPLLSTHHLSPLAASLALQTALQTTAPISAVNSLDAEGGASSDEESDDDDAGGEQDGWRQGATAKGKARARNGGFVVCQIERNGLRFVAPVTGNVDPIVPLHYLSSLHAILESYISAPLTEGSLKDHFDLVLLLLSESLSPSSGLPLLTQTPTLRDLVPPNGGNGLAKAVAGAAAGLGGATGVQHGPGGGTGLLTPSQQLLTSPLPWRRQGIRHSANEIYFDHQETLSILLSSTSQPLSTTLSGSISARSKLSGMPDLTLSFADPSLLPLPSAGLTSFHPCVRLPRYSRDRTVSFIPPEGAFDLLSYTLPSSTSFSGGLSPIAVKSTFTTGSAGGSFDISLSPRAIVAGGVERLLVRIDDLGGSLQVSGVTGGVWKVEDKCLVWEMDSLVVGKGASRLWGTVSTTTSSSSLPFPAAYTISFSTPAAVFSAVRVGSVKVAAGGGEVPQLYKGVRTKGRGEIEGALTRCTAPADGRSDFFRWYWQQVTTLWHPPLPSSSMPVKRELSSPPPASDEAPGRKVSKHDTRSASSLRNRSASHMNAPVTSKWTVECPPAVQVVVEDWSAIATVLEDLLPELFPAPKSGGLCNVASAEQSAETGHWELKCGLRRASFHRAVKGCTVDVEDVSVVSEDAGAFVCHLNAKQKEEGRFVYLYFKSTKQIAERIAREM